MNNAQKHIVGTCRWITQFDSQKKAMALQSEISQWSKYQMLREIDWVLNEICPPDKTMIIETLELDIGTLSYENLSQELPLQFSEKLKEALRSMMQASGKGESNLRILSQDQSYFDTLQYFLQYGYVSNGLSQEENLHSIIDLLLTNHKVRAIQMIRVLLKEENIRKRIAWQFKDEIIKKIIKELEPSNYDYIIDFTDQVTFIQRKENILNTSLADFKKNLWFWIFNYLFVERGTMFNKMAFVRSTLIQMASHFNLIYEELFELIEAAVSRIDHHKKGEFLSILRAIYQQKKKTHFTSQTSQKEINQYWQDLEQFFNDKSTRILSEKKRYFNELIVNLHQQDARKFKNVIDKIGEKESDWLEIVPDLTAPSLEVIFRVFNTHYGNTIYTQTKAIKKLRAAELFKVTDEEITSIAISYTIQTRSQSYTTKALLRYVIQKLSAKNGKAKHVFFKRLIDDELTTEKSQNLFEITRELEVLFKDQMIEDPKTLTKTRLSKLIKNQRDISSQKELSIWLQTQPQKVWELVTKDEKQFSHFIERIELKKGEKLLQIAGQNYHGLINKMKRMLQEIHQTISDKQLQIAALQVLKKFKNPSESIFMMELVKRLVWKSSTVVKKSDFLEAIHQMENNATWKLSTKQYKFDVFKTELKSKTLLDVCLDEMRKGELPKKDVLLKIASLIQSDTVSFKSLEFHEETFIAYVFGKKTLDKSTIFSKLKTKILKHYINLSIAELNETLYEIYWKTLIQYEIHQGKVAQWKRLLEENMAHRYPMLIQKNATKKTIDFSRKTTIRLKDIEEFPEEIKTWVHDSKDEKKVLELLSKELSAIEFHGLMLPIMDSMIQPYFKAFISMYEVLESKVPQDQIEMLKVDFWKYGIHLIRGKKPEIIFRKLINTVVEKLSLHPEIDQNILVEAFVKKGLHEYIHVEYQQTRQSVQKQNDSIQKYIQDHKIESLIEYILKKQEIPIWFDNSSKYTHVSLFKQCLIRQPHKVIQILRKDEYYIDQLERIASAIELMEILEKLYVHQGVVLNHVAKLYRLLGTLSGFGISADQWQQALMNIVIRCWIHSHWKPLAASHLWMELLWEVNKIASITQTQFVSAMRTIENALPSALLTALMYVKYAKETLQSKPIEYMKKMTIGVPVRNAGLVMLNTYFKILFDRLGLLNGDEFINEETQLKAIHYLQYIVTGLTATEESLLVLNKLLCGVDIESPIKESIEMDLKDKELIDGMIESSVAYWSSIGTTSVAGFRGNWLVRDGMLKEEEDRWELTVEKRSYDILMNKSPFSFSIIKLPWMKKPLHVIWPF